MRVWRTRSPVSSAIEPMPRQSRLSVDLWRGRRAVGSRPTCPNLQTLRAPPGEGAVQSSDQQGSGLLFQRDEQPEHEVGDEAGEDREGPDQHEQDPHQGGIPSPPLGEPSADAGNDAAPAGPAQRPVRHGTGRGIGRHSSALDLCYESDTPGVPCASVLPSPPVGTSGEESAVKPRLRDRRRSGPGGRLSPRPHHFYPQIRSRSAGAQVSGVPLVELGHFYARPEVAMKSMC